MNQRIKSEGHIFFLNSPSNQAESKINQKYNNNDPKRWNIEDNAKAESLRKSLKKLNPNAEAKDTNTD